VERAIADLVDMGLVADSGRRRNGRIVWEVTPLGIKLAKNAPDLLEAMLAGGAGAKQ
jgi:hypothetical protein